MLNTQINVDVVPQGTDFDVIAEEPSVESHQLILLGTPEPKESLKSIILELVIPKKKKAGAKRSRN